MCHVKKAKAETSQQSQTFLHNYPDDSILFTNVMIKFNVLCGNIIHLL